MARSESQVNADVKCNKKAYERIPFDVRRDADITGDVIRAHAATMGESLNSFLKRAVAETMERDKQHLAEVNSGSSD